MMSNRTTPVWKIAGISLLLAGLVWLVFGQTLRHQFVNFDDGSYVYRNFDVTHGITIQGIKWAFTHVVGANWHPLTMLSHLLDCRLYGVTPAGHHATNVVLHTAAVVLLFLVFWWMTRKLWQSAFVAAVFGIHPLHVESVAWVAERKDVLSALFFMLTLAAYVYYARRTSLARYLLVSILFACGLMSKPMLVTLPFVLLLLDYWPLQRFVPNREGSIGAISDGRLRPGWWPVLEKLPLFALSGAASVTALITQHPSLNTVNRLPLASRLGNACVTAIIYIGQMMLPRDLACFYPYPKQSLPLWGIALSISLLVGLTAGAWSLRKTRPYFLTGWLWYVGMLIPVIGIVQVGAQAHADRYTYLPQIGLYLIVTWGLADLFISWRHRGIILGALATAALVVLTWCAWFQTSYWRDSESLWTHALAVTPDNVTARQDLCDALLEKGRVDDAISQGRRALELEPKSGDVNNTMGAALTRKGQLDEALVYLTTALQLRPTLPRLRYNLANVLLQKGEVDEAIANYETELRIQPNFPEGHNNLANALFRKGEPDAAFLHLKAALELNPNYPEAHNNLGIALSQKGEMREAIAQWNKTLKIQPDNVDAQCNLVWVFATFPDPSIRNGSKAVELAKRALELSGGTNARIWRLAAVAYAEDGRFPEAIKAGENALGLAEAQGNSTLVRTLEMNIALFRDNSPLRDTSQAK